MKFAAVIFQYAPCVFEVPHSYFLYHSACKALMMVNKQKARADDCVLVKEHSDEQPWNTSQLWYFKEIFNRIGPLVEGD